MKKKITTLGALLAVVLPLSVLAVSDKVLESNSEVWSNVKYEGKNINGEGEIEAQFEVRSLEDELDELEIEVDDVEGVEVEDDDEDESKDNEGRGEEHRSEVASFVQKLLYVADRNGGLGEEIRNIAREQASSSEDVALAVEKIEKRSKFKIFLIGTDYKNLGEIRSELVRTENRVEKLKKEVEKLIPFEQEEIEAEIAKIESEREDLLKFIEENEDRFSLFGWFVKIF